MERKNKRSFFRTVKDLLNGKDPGVVGAIVGFIIALLLLIFGFFKTIFLILITVAGYYIGTKYFRNKDDFKDFLNKILPPGLFR